MILLTYVTNRKKSEIQYFLYTLYICVGRENKVETTRWAS